MDKSEYNKQYKLTHKDEIREYNREYQKKFRKTERYKKTLAEYNEKHINERRAYMQDYYQKNREKILLQHKKIWDKDKNKNYSLLKLYGITLEFYNELFEKQKGCCAICNKPQSEFKKAFAVDHDHTTGEIRGLICEKCNQGIGLFNDDVEVLLKAIEYLRNTNNSN